MSKGSKAFLYMFFRRGAWSLGSGIWGFKALGLRVWGGSGLRARGVGV